MSIRDICTEHVVTIEPDATAAEAAKRMRNRHVGDLVVVETVGGRRRPIGVLTDRDLVIGIIAKSVDAADVRVSELVTEKLATIGENDDLPAAITAMRAHGIRRLPVVSSGGEPVGVLTLDDAIDALSANLASLATVMRRQPDEERKRRT